MAGIARRFLQDDPAELARFAAMSIRTEWILVGDGREGCSGQGLDALWALTVVDERMLDRLLTTLPDPLHEDRASQHPSYYLQLYNAVFGVLRGDRETARHSVEPFQARKLPAHEAALVTCLGVLEASAETVAQGLAALGRAVRRIRAVAPHHKLLDMTLHGAYELCRRVDPALNRLWDRAQGLPWDAALYEWRRAGRGPLEGVDFTALPARCRVLLTELPEPD